MSALPASLVMKEGIKGTSVSDLGGIGLGYQYQGAVYVSGGNGFYYIKTDLSYFLPDGGARYMGTVAATLGTDFLSRMAKGK